MRRMVMLRRGKIVEYQWPDRVDSNVIVCRRVVEFPGAKHPITIDESCSVEVPEGAVRTEVGKITWESQ